MNKFIIIFLYFSYQFCYLLPGFWAWRTINGMDMNSFPILHVFYNKLMEEIKHLIKLIKINYEIWLKKLFVKNRFLANIVKTGTKSHRQYDTTKNYAHDIVCIQSLMQDKFNQKCKFISYIHFVTTNMTFWIKQSLQCLVRGVNLGERMTQYA